MRFPGIEAGSPERTRAEVDSRWRADRDARLSRAAQAAKWFERDGRYADSFEAGPRYRVGSTVQVIA